MMRIIPSNVEAHSADLAWRIEGGTSLGGQSGRWDVYVADRHVACFFTRSDARAHIRGLKKAA